MKIFLLLFFLVSLNLWSGDNSTTDIDFKQATEDYLINRGDTLATIALKHKVSVTFLLTINENLPDPDRIFIGQSIKVPNAETIKLIEKESQNNYRHFIEKLGAEKSITRQQAVKEMIQLDWRVTTVLLSALKSADPEVRENAREILRTSHQSRQRCEKLCWANK